MTPLDTGLTVAAGATAGVATAASTIGAANFALTVISAAVGAGVAWGVLRKGAEAHEAQVEEVKAALLRQGEVLAEIRERLARLEERTRA